MGLCFSKKQQVRRRREELPSNEATKRGTGGGGVKKCGDNKGAVVVTEAKKAPQAKPAAAKRAAVPKAEEPAADKRTVFVVKAAAAAAAAEVAAEANGVEVVEEEVKRAAPEEEAKPVVVSRVPVRTSSCTKEEVDAILIQCGRLSRSSSSSGKVAASGDKRYSGSKRSYDFDRERRGGGVDDDCDWERQGAAVSRPSPRRRTPERKRSGSHERGGGGGSGSRRVSRSPGRRADGSVPAAASSGSGAERVSRQQPGKMVSVPAREKMRAPSPVAAASGKRYPSPRSNSPARAGNENATAHPTHGPSLSRSSSRKAEQSPYRRNPMAELDENALGNNHNNHNSSNGKPQKKTTESAVAMQQKVKEKKPEIMEEAAASSDTKATRGRMMNATHSVSIVAEGGGVNPRGRSSRRSSRDFDNNGNSEKPEILEEAVASSDTKAASGRMNATHSVSIVAESVANPRARPSSRRSSRDFDSNGNSYASLLLEDIQHYHQKNTGAGVVAGAVPAFSLPACVSKACSILEAVADLNSSSSETKSFELDRSANDKCSINGRYGDGRPVVAAGTVVVESEVVVKDDLMEPSLHKYVSVRDIRGEAAEPQESAGSNSFVDGNAWTCSWEPNSVGSTDRTWTASNGDDVERSCSDGVASPLEQQSWQSKQKVSSSQVGSTTTSNAQRGRSSALRGGGGGGGGSGNGSVVSS